MRMEWGIEGKITIYKGLLYYELDQITHSAIAPFFIRYEQSS